jgi:hypothetical protein
MRMEPNFILKDATHLINTSKSTEISTLFKNNFDNASFGFMSCISFIKTSKVRTCFGATIKKVMF